MRSITTLFLCLLLTSGIAPAQATPYTILAPSGLNLRSGPGPQHPKLVTLPFGTVVEADLTQVQLAYFEAVPPPDAQVIEGHRGFWMPMRYREHAGYLFSGFVLPGERLVPSTDQNRDFRLLQTGYSCGPWLNYDPQLNWYAMEQIGGVVQFKPTKVRIRLRQSFAGRDTMQRYWEYMNYIVECDPPSPNHLLLVGTRKPVPMLPPASRNPGKHNGESWEPCLLDAGQAHTVAYKGGSYRFFGATPQPGDAADRPGSYRLHVGIRLPGQTQEQVLSLNKDLGLDELLLNELRGLNAPQLKWTGDINGDGYLDFIIYWKVTAEYCGGVRFGHSLFLTAPAHPKRLIHMIASEDKGNCN